MVSYPKLTKVIYWFIIHKMVKLCKSSSSSDDRFWILSDWFFNKHALITYVNPVIISYSLWLNNNVLIDMNKARPTNHNIPHKYKIVAQLRGCVGYLNTSLKPYLWIFHSITVEKRFNIFLIYIVWLPS